MAITFQELNLNNAFLFSEVLRDSENCKMILEIILGRVLPDITVNVEHSIMFSSDTRCLRLDVFATDTVEVEYNMEMQNYDRSKLPKRSRFHLAALDVTSLKPGEGFEELKPVYVIFICTFDPFDKGLYQYTFEPRCKESDFSLADETYRIFLNTKGTNDADVAPELVNFLHYLENTTDTYVEQAQDEKLTQLHHKVQALKQNRKLEGRYMTLYEWMEQAKRAAVEEAVAEAVAEASAEASAEKAAAVTEAYRRSGELYKRMRDVGREQEYWDAMSDPKLFEQLFQEYNV